jgi:hypothetical protein
MCFSATANFVGSAILGGIGVATLTEVKHRRELLFATMPCLFAFHQFIEATLKQRRQMLPFAILGGALMLYMLWGLIAYPLQVSVQDNSIVYVNIITTTTLIAILYVIATCGSLFFSGFRDLITLAWLNLVGLLVVMLVKRYAFTSVWCAYAAIVSVIIYFFFRRSRLHRPSTYAVAA